ncbi:MAG: hypothetical protein CMO81_00665 [Waddliaceae bacterium]|nr:hypothetical protein [Waddliaceae bacterium]
MDLYVTSDRYSAVTHYLQRLAELSLPNTQLNALEYSLVCASMAKKQGLDDLCVLAALFQHVDLGYFMSEGEDEWFSREDEGFIAALLLGFGLSEELAKLALSLKKQKKPQDENRLQNICKSAETVKSCDLSLESFQELLTTCLQEEEKSILVNA